MKPDYCLYEEGLPGGCRQCSLSSYGRDCQNNQILDKESDDDGEA